MKAFKAFVVCFLCVFSVPAISQKFPSCNSMRMVIAYPAGGGTDIQGRIIAQKLSEKWGKNVVVENRGGGGTVIATAIVAKATPGGCTLLLTALPFAINPFVMEKLPYEEKELAPVTQTLRFPQVLVVTPSIPVRTVKELLALAASTPEKISFGSTGHLGTSHLAGELLSSMSGVKLVHVPYKGASPAHADLFSGRVPMMFDSLGSINRYITSGQVRAIAVTSVARSSQLPNVPTVAESGYPGFEVAAWHGVVTTGGTGKDVVEKISADIRDVLQNKEMRDRMAQVSAEIVASTPSDFQVFIKAEANRWGKIIRDLDIKK
ncbi:MAG: tripartite tricarboxylate transporter substrate binding protein [Burkholderiales bacterium]|nr:tripartite tricarboxylate transporter substrate binding protein [Burkholderiales bacterium]